MESNMNDMYLAPEAVRPAADNEVHVNDDAAASSSTRSEVSGQLNNLRRILRARTQYEKLQRPSDIAAGCPIPSIEGWVLFLSNLPATSTVEDIQDIFVSFKDDDPNYFGLIREVKIPLDKDCLCPGYALVELDTHEGYQRALTEMQGTPITYAVIDEAHPTLPGLRLSPAFLGEEDDEEEEQQQQQQQDGHAGDEVTGEKRGRCDSEV